MSLDVALSLDELLALAEKNPGLRPDAARALRQNPKFGRRMHWEVWAAGLDHGLNHRKWIWDVEWIAAKTVHLHLTFFPPGAGLISGHITATGVLYSDGSVGLVNAVLVPMLPDLPDDDLLDLWEVAIFYPETRVAHTLRPHLEDLGHLLRARMRPWT